MPSKILEVGVEWIVDASGCEPEALRSVTRLTALFDGAVRELGLHPLAEARFHQFPPPGGVTGFLILSESHLACHTYPEFGAATFNLYCCRDRPEWDWHRQLVDILGATDVEVRVVRRYAQPRFSVPEPQPVPEPGLCTMHPQR